MTTGKRSMLLPGHMRKGSSAKALELSLCCPGLLYPEFATTSESESEEVKNDLPFCALLSPF